MDSNSIHSGSAMLMLLTVVFVGLAAFFIYKFKRCVHSDKKLNCAGFSCKCGNLTQLLCSFFLVFRKIPWIHVQTEDSHEKEPEVISTVGQNDNMSKVKLSEFPSPKELMAKDLEARSRGTCYIYLFD